MSFFSNNSLLLGTRKEEQEYPHNPLNLVLVYDTSKELANNIISVPLNGTVNCTIDWGDGTSNSYTTTGFKTKTYASPGVYIVQISGTMTRLDYGIEASTTNNKLKLVRCLSFGEIGLTSLFQAFMNCSNLIQCPASLPTTVTSLRGCFLGCTQFNDESVVSWNTEAVTTMAAMFYNATSFNRNIDSWNLVAVTTTQNMFFNATSFNQPIGSWNTSAVTNMSSMFQNAPVFNQDISSWDIRKVTTMTNMFSSNIWGSANYDAALSAWADLPDTDLKTQAITSFAAGAGGGSNTLVTSNNHGMVAGSRVNISGTINYNGDYNVVGLVLPNEFQIGVTFVGNDATGTMKHRRSRNVTANFGTNKYSSGVPATKRAVLTSTYGWTITDGGRVI